MGLPRDPAAARPHGGRPGPQLPPRGRARTPAPRGNSGSRQAETAQLATLPERVGPTWKHSPAGRGGACSSGFASLCPALAPPLAPELPRSHFPHVPGFLCGPRPAPLRRTAFPARSRRGLVQPKEIFFPLLRLHGFFRGLALWIRFLSGADSSRRGGRRRPGGPSFGAGRQELGRERGGDSPRRVGAAE